MSKEMVIATSPHETKVALLEEGQVVEVFVEREKEFGLVGSIYKGRVTRVLPGMQSAFVDVGLDRDAFLYVSDFFEDLEEYEREAAPAEADQLPAEGETSAAATAEPGAPEPGLTGPGLPESAVPESPEPFGMTPQDKPFGMTPQDKPFGMTPQDKPFGMSPQDEPFGVGPQGKPLDEAQPPFEERQPLSFPGESFGATPQDKPFTVSPQDKPRFVRAEPPLSLPERRPLGRPPRRGRPPRHRGGRGRRHGPGPLPPREARPYRESPRPFREAPPSEPYEPIILPGESLAKYRDRKPAAPPPVEPAPARSPEVAPESPAAETPFGALEPESNVRPQESRAEPAELPVAELRREEAGPAAEARSEAPPDEEAPSARPATDEAPAPESPSEGYPEASTLAEIERVRRYESQVGLPPSVHDRTAGGVDWGRSRGPGVRRGRHRRPRGGGRLREPRRAGPAPRRPERSGYARPSRPSRGQPAIAELLRPGQEIIVQIAKEQMGKKGARITSHVSLPGRFLVYMPTIEHMGVSRKIGTSEERSRLRRLLLELKGSITGGFVVRTAATGCTEEDLRQDIDYLVKLWHDVRVRADERPSPALLHHDLSLMERILRDQLSPDYESVWIDSEEEYTKVVEFVAHFQPALASRVKLYTKEAHIFDEMGVQQEIERALQPKVWLKSGGYIVINHTEALVAIDVNTGKYVGKGSTRLEDTIVRTNLDAVKEIVRQIRLRDLGGIIVIDFIDMEDRRNRARVMHALEDALRADRSPSKTLAFNEFGLVAITRKRSRLSLERLLCQPCPYCTGTGMVKAVPTLCYEIQGEAKKMAATIDAPELTIRAHPEIVKALKGRDGALVRELEELTGKNIILQADTTLHFDQYNIY